MSQMDSKCKNVKNNHKNNF